MTTVTTGTPETTGRSAGRAILAQLAAIVGVALIVAGLWAWDYSGAWAQRADRPDTAVWAVRLAALAAMAMAQVLFALGVIPGFFRRKALERAYAAICGLAAVLATVAAVALAASAW